ncbi:MAG: right-handed parallel beta-helix repeat-containing protein [Algibacter sp.]
MKNILPIIIISLISLLGVAQTNYYVSTSGNNSNNGSITTPFLSIQTALDLASAGDIIYVRSGSYAEKLWWTNSGTSGNPITITNYNDESVILSGTSASNASQGALILISSKSHIRINGIIFADNIMNYADGIYATGSGTDIEITNCEFRNIGWTLSKTTMPSSSNSAHAIIFVGTTTNSYNTILISENYIHDCITGYSESVTMAGNIDSFIIENNTINFNTNIGIDAAGHFSWTGAPDNVNYARNGSIKNNVVSDFDGPTALDAAGGIYIDGGSFITVENNTVFNYSVGFSIGCEVAGKSNEGNLIQNNLAYNCSLSGLFLGSNTTSVVNDTEVYNNTFYKCGTGTYDNGQIALLNNSGSDIKNNIMYPTDGRYAIVQFDGTVSTNPVITYNLFWRDNSITTNFFYGITGAQNTVLSNPLFENVSTYDFHLTGSSPAINAGDPSYSPEAYVYDIDGQSRLNGGSVDIGVDEYNSTLDTNSFHKSEISLYPNPTHGIININDISNYSCEIYNLNGQAIKIKEYGFDVIDISSQQDGMYILKLTNNNTLKESYIKLIKQ